MSVLFAAKEKGVLAGLFGAASGSDSDSEPEGAPGAGSPEQGAAGEEKPGQADQTDQSGLTELVHRSESARGAFEVRVYQHRIKGIAHQLWPAATHLCRYIDTNLDSVFSAHGGVEGARVIELGAGVGLVGVYLSALGCRRVILTDLQQAMEIIQTNIDANKTKTASSSSTLAMPLSWGNAAEAEAVVLALLCGGESAAAPESEEPPPLIVAADCVYWESLFELLADTLCLLCRRCQGARVLMSHVRRWKKDAKFFKLCVKKGLNVTVLSETVEHVPAEHTGLPERTITRVYLISSQH